MKKQKGEEDEFKMRTNPKKQKTNPHGASRGKVAPGREIETQAAIDSINNYQWGKHILYQ